jgi:hypothetical protein
MEAGKGPLVVLLTVTRSLFLAITRAMFTVACAVSEWLSARPASYSVTFRRPAATSASSMPLGPSRERSGRSLLIMLERCSAGRWGQSLPNTHQAETLAGGPSDSSDRHLVVASSHRLTLLTHQRRNPRTPTHTFGLGDRWVIKQLVSIRGLTRLDAKRCHLARALRYDPRGNCRLGVPLTSPVTLASRLITAHGALLGVGSELRLGSKSRLGDCHLCGIDCAGGQTWTYKFEHQRRDGNGGRRCSCRVLQETGARNSKSNSSRTPGPSRALSQSQ